MTRQQRIGHLVALLGFLFIAALTLTPQEGSPSYPPSLCIVCGERAAQDIILNVLLFIPFGVGLRLMGTRRRIAIGIAAITTITVELLQMHVIPGRDSSLGDVITNTTGGVLGVVLVDTARAWLAPRAAVARRLMWVGAALWGGVMVTTSWALRRALPATTMWGQWEPDLLGFDRFGGSLVTASVAGVPFPNGVLGVDPAFRRRLVGDSALVQATVVTGPLTRRPAPIVSVYDWDRTQILMLDQDGRTLQFSIRMNADRLLMRNPSVRVRAVFPTGGTRDTIRIAGGVVHHALVARAVWPSGHEAEQRIPLSPGLGWVLFIPFGYALGPETPLLSALWVAGLIVPVAFWGRLSERPRALGLALAGAALAGFVIAPALAGGAIATWWEWGALFAGTWIGITLSRLIRPAPRRVDESNDRPMRRTAGER